MTRPGSRPAALLGTLLAATLVLTACGDGDGGPAEVTASPIPGGTEASPDPTASPTPAPSPSPSPSPEPTPSPSASPGETAPTDADRGRFVSSYRPEDASGLQHVAVDTDGDGIEELVFAYVRSSAGVSHLDVAWWDGSDYGIGFRADGGPASRIDDVRVSDITADGRREIVLSQSTSGGSSLTVWQVRGRGDAVGLVARGGCHDGSNTYGVVGASLENRDDDPALEIVASCDDSPLPVAAWHSDVYDWSGAAYVDSGDV